jgi:predicted nucleic acid-binding protein
VDEIRQGFLSGKVPSNSLEWLVVLELSELEQQIFSQYRTLLGAGEAAALAVCVSRQLRLATDDYEARQMATQLRVPLTGTVGLLMMGVKRNLITLEVADEWLRQMIQHGYRSPVQSLEEI